MIQQITFLEVQRILEEQRRNQKQTKIGQRGEVQMMDFMKVPQRDILPENLKTVLIM